MDFIEKINLWGAEKKPFIFLIDFEQKKPMAWLAADCPEHFQIRFNHPVITSQFSNKPIKVASSGKEPTRHTKTLKKFPISVEEYQVKFKQVQAALNRGDSFLINLTIPTPVQDAMDFNSYFTEASSKYVAWLKDEFISFSPETFIQIINGRIATFPMKGTIDASIPNAKELILNDPKEYAEHATIVDLLRNDLSKVASNVRVTNFRYYEELATQQGLIGQVSSAIEGDLPKDYAASIGSLLFELLPAGSVSGAPKQKTAQLIAEIEGEDRGYYTGVAGYFDGVNLDSCVLIRYLEAGNKYRSGGGITFQSDMLSEYQEMIKKVYVPIH